MIGVDDCRMRMCVDCRKERCRNELDRMCCHDGETGNFSRIEIKDRCKIYGLSMKRDIRKITCPDVMRITRKLCEQEIRERSCFFLLFAPFPASPTIWLYAKDIHYPLHSFSVHPEHKGDPTRAVAWMITERWPRSLALTASLSVRAGSGNTGLRGRCPWPGRARPCSCSPSGSILFLGLRQFHGDLAHELKERLVFPLEFRYFKPRGIA